MWRNIPRKEDKMPIETNARTKEKLEANYDRNEKFKRRLRPKYHMMSLNA